MTQNEKDLLLKDISGRLPYGVKCNVGEDKPYTLSRVEIDDKNGHLLDFIETKEGLDMQVYLSEIKPYLFPLSSMTVEQTVKYCQLQDRVIYNTKGLVTKDVMEYVNWCYENHLDINDLIPKGLALDATGLNIYW